jgi:hypothetical protein
MINVGNDGYIAQLLGHTNVSYLRNFYPRRIPIT